jgi:gamma-glutamyl hercynylcysteine S-oxide synthase
MSGLRQDADSPAVRAAGPDLLSLALMDARNHTLQLLGHWADPRATPLARPVDPLAPWRIAGSIGWFADAWIVRNPQRGMGRCSPADGIRMASSASWADPCFHPRARAAEPLPSVEAIRQWLLDTLEATLEQLEHPPDRESKYKKESVPTCLPCSCCPV